MDLGVAGRLYIVLGGSRGMGFEAARLLAQEGARLALISRSISEIEAAADRIAGEFGVEALGLGADASQPDQVEQAIEAAMKRFGQPSGLLVTSGLTGRNGSLLATSDADWEANFQDVLMGHVRACRAVLPSMIEAGGGTIVTTAAYSARVAKGFLFPYAAQKAAVINLTRNLAKTYGPQGIRANCVCPGAFDTVRVNALVQQVMAERDLDHAAASAWVLENRFGMPVALRRLGRPQAAADLMVFLLSDRAAYMTGAIINIDGGGDF